MSKTDLQALAHRTDRQILEDVLIMATKATIAAEKAAAKAEDSFNRSDANTEDIGKLTSEVARLTAKVEELRTDVGKWPKGPDDPGTGLLGAAARRSPSLVDEYEANQKVSPPTVPPAVRTFFKTHPIVAKTVAAVAAVAGVGLAIAEALGILR